MTQMILSMKEKQTHRHRELTSNYQGGNSPRDILECEVKWALRSITMNKASRGDKI